MEMVPELDRLTQIFSNAIAPSFFLGAVAAFVSLMMSRLAAVNAQNQGDQSTPDSRRRCRRKQHVTWDAHAPRMPAQ